MASSRGTESGCRLRASAERHRSPLVLQCLEDYLAGRRAPLELVHTDASVHQQTG